MSRLHIFFAFVFFIGLSLLTGAIGALFTIEQIPTWYQSLQKPSWTPPNEVFGPVWNILYVLMGSAAALAWVKGGFTKVISIWVFVAHLVVNALWSIVFFALHEVLLALYIILVLWVMIVVLMFLFSRHSRLAAWLLFPYLVWVTYAITLNAGILFLN